MAYSRYLTMANKPRIRFKGFTEDWEQRKLGDLLILLKDGSHGTHKNTDEGVYLLSAKNIKNGENEVTPNEKLDNKDQNKKKKKDKTDKEKKVIEAEDKEIEGISKYDGPVHKFIATREGKVLKAEGEKEKHPTASLAKVMNIIVALDEIDKGNASLDDEVCFTPDTAYLKEAG